MRLAQSIGSLLEEITVGLSELNLAKAFEPIGIDHEADDANNDLVWDLERFQQRKLAQEFVLQFENRICVYSSSVQQIYTNFNVFFPKEEGHKLVILPNPFAHYDVFYGVPEEAVRPTGLMVMPDYYSEDQQMVLRIPLKNTKDPYKIMPLKEGLTLLNSRRPPEQPLLPLLMKGDLRELDEGTPSLHLHSINLAKLKSLAPMEIAGIKAVILDKLDRL